MIPEEHIRDVLSGFAFRIRNDLSWHGDLVEAEWDKLVDTFIDVMQSKYKRGLIKWEDFSDEQTRIVMALRVYANTNAAQQK